MIAEVALVVVFLLGAALFVLRSERASRAKLELHARSSSSKDDAPRRTDRLFVVALVTAGLIAAISYHNRFVELATQYLFVATALFAIVWFATKRRELERLVTYKAGLVALIIVVGWFTVAALLEDLGVADRPSSRSVPGLAIYSFLIAYLVLRRRAA